MGKNQWPSTTRGQILLKKSRYVNRGVSLGGLVGKAAGQEEGRKETSDFGGWWLVVQRYSRKPFLLDLPDQDDPKEEGCGGRGLLHPGQSQDSNPYTAGSQRGLTRGVRHHVHTLYVSPYRRTPLSPTDTLVMISPGQSEISQDVS